MNVHLTLNHVREVDRRGGGGGRRPLRGRRAPWTSTLAACLGLAMTLGAGASDRPASSTPGQESPATEAPDAETPKVEPAPLLGDTKPRDYPGLHNVVAFGDGFYSGSVPEGDAGFDTLKAWGIRTIISVDGAVPDVEAAKVRGMRYVHLPIGYNGFDEARKLSLVRATRDLQKPIYVHCHHGKHRSAGAAGTVAVSLGWLTPEEAMARMKVSGTAPSYKGLYQCTAGAAKLAGSVIDAAPAEFPEVSLPSGFVQSMVQIDEAVEHLKAIERAGWRTPANHPDLVPAAEAGRLADLLRLLRNDESVAARPADFAELLARNAAEAQTLEDLLAAPGDPPTERLSAQFKLLNASCKECHVKHRD